MVKNAWEKLNECMCQGVSEGPEDDFSDDDLDALTSPQKSFSNPFDTHARTTAKVNQPQTKMRANTKPQMSAPAPKNDFGQAVSPNAARSITKQTLQQKPGAAQSSASASPTTPPKPLAKPNYRGDRVGQVFRSNGQTQPYRAMWKDKGGDMRFGKSGERETKVDLVWDGNDWISPEEFDAKAKSGQIKSEDISSLLAVFKMV